MRDLERLQDVVEYRVSPGQLRLVLLGVLAVACAIFAVGVSVGKRLEPGSTALAVDPLAGLDRAAASASAEEPEHEQPALTYHDELTQPDSPRRHEAAEGDRARHLDGEGQRQPPAEPEAGPSASRSRTPEPAAAPRVAEQVPTEPAQPEELEPGESSVFTLQVGSFETQEEANQFATDLRAHGHPTFLVRTGTPERGNWFRVRVGPFHSRREAASYQTRFERQERLPTFLVQRRIR